MGPAHVCVVGPAHVCVVGSAHVCVVGPAHVCVVGPAHVCVVGPLCCLSCANILQIPELRQSSLYQASWPIVSALSPPFDNTSCSRSCS